MRKTVAVVGVFAVAGVAGPALGTPVAYDGFESYTAGTGLNGGSAGTGTTGAGGEFGWTGNWIAVSGINVQPSAPVGARTGESDGTTDNIVAATRAFTPQTGTVYFSLRYDPAAGLEGSDFVHFYLSNNATSNNNSGGFGDIDTSTAAFGARVGTTNGGTTVNSSTTAAQGATYLLVGKLSKVSATNYNRLDLFINPTGSTEPGTADATSSADAGISQVSVFGLRTFNLDAGDKYQFDDVRIGTTFADVVPEPASLGVLAAGGVGLLGRRRRRTA